MTQKNQSRTITLPKIIVEEIEVRAQAEGGDVSFWLLSHLYSYLGLEKVCKSCKTIFNSSKTNQRFCCPACGRRFRDMINRNKRRIKNNGRRNSKTKTT